MYIYQVEWHVKMHVKLHVKLHVKINAKMYVGISTRQHDFRVNASICFEKR